MCSPKNFIRFVLCMHQIKPEFIIFKCINRASVLPLWNCHYRSKQWVQTKSGSFLLCAIFGPNIRMVKHVFVCARSGRNYFHNLKCHYYLFTANGYWAVTGLCAHTISLFLFHILAWIWKGQYRICFMVVNFTFLLHPLQMERTIILFIFASMHKPIQNR